MVAGEHKITGRPSYVYISFGKRPHDLHFKIYFTINSFAYYKFENNSLYCYKSQVDAISNVKFFNKTWYKT